MKSLMFWKDYSNQTQTDTVPDLTTIMPPWQQVSKQPTNWWPVADTLLVVNLHKSASLQTQQPRPISVKTLRCLKELS